MAIVIITKTLEKEINRAFKKESIKIFELMKSLGRSPNKGKYLAKIGGIIIKELKYNSFRFYYITDKFKIKLLDINELNNLLIKFVRFSNKKNQQKVIDEIKRVLRSFGSEGFN